MNIKKAGAIITIVDNLNNHKDFIGGSIDMSIISVTPEQLRDSAKVYINASNEITAQINRVQSENQVMNQEWKGQAFQSYEQQFEQLKSNVKQMTDLLETINRQLVKYADTVEQRDREDSNAFGLQ